MAAAGLMELACLPALTEYDCVFSRTAAVKALEAARPDLVVVFRR